MAASRKRTVANLSHGMKQEFGARALEPLLIGQAADLRFSRVRYALIRAANKQVLSVICQLPRSLRKLKGGAVGRGAE